MLYRLSATGAFVLALAFTACSSNAPSTVVPAAAACSSGQPFPIQVFADPYHQQPTCQFDPERGTAAYVFMANVNDSDVYVMYVETTGANPRCVYSAPRGKSGPSCNPQTANVRGVNAPGGSLSFTWKLATSLPDGPYSVAVYDQTLESVLGTVQVTLRSGS